MNKVSAEAVTSNVAIIDRSIEPSLNCICSQGVAVHRAWVEAGPIVGNFVALQRLNPSGTWLTGRGGCAATA